MKRAVLYFGLAASLLSVGSAQPGAGSPKFEVATIRLGAPLPDGTAPRCTGGPGTSDPTTFRCPCKSLALLIQFVFDVTPAGLDGVSLMDSACYDIAAKVALGATRDQLRLMLQNLLVERFHLAWHHETRTLPTYSLVVTKGGPKLKASAAQPATTDAPADGAAPAKKTASTPPWAVSIAPGGYYRFTATRMDLKSFAVFLEALLGSPVVDQTGLAGTYEFTLNYRPADAPAGLQFNDENGFPVTDVASALPPQLGLKLDTQKLPRDVVVIDHLDKTPIEN